MRFKTREPRAFFRKPPRQDPRVDTQAERDACLAYRGPRAPTAFSAEELLAEAGVQGNRPFKMEWLSFEGVGGRQVFNPSSMLTIDGRRALWARVVPRGADPSQSVVVPFRETASGSRRMEPISKGHFFEVGEDPSLIQVWQGDQPLNVLGIVDPEPRFPAQRQSFYVVSDDFEKLDRVARMPPGMKNVRIFSLLGGDLGVFTRPISTRALEKGAAGPKGSVGFTTVPGLGGLTPEAVEGAPLLGGQIDPYDWWGVNDAIQMPDGEILVLAHIGTGEYGVGPYYYPMLGRLDSPAAAAVTGLSAGRVPFTRADLQVGPEGNSRRDIIFPGGFTPGDPHQFTVGVDDNTAGVIDLHDEASLSDWLVRDGVGDPAELEPV